MNDEIILKNELMQSNPEINETLKKAGCSVSQIQIFYDLIAEELMPVIEELIAEGAKSEEISRLETYFGGPEKANEILRQISLWANKNLAEDVCKILTASADGIIVLYHMMQESEPATADLRGTKEQTVSSEQDLKKIMSSPAYWRDKDPSTVSKVERGFKQLYDRA